MFISNQHLTNLLSSDEKIMEHVDDLLQTWSQSFSIFKIGITGNPKIRKYGHILRKWVEEPNFLEEFGLNPKDFSQSRRPWKEMVIIYKSDNPNRIKNLERKLITEYSLIKRNKPFNNNFTCWNIAPGGEGPLKSKNSISYYLYILIG